MKKFVVGGIVLGLVTLGWSSRSFGEQVTALQGELRIVDTHHANWISIVLNVFEHLVALDKDGQLVPRLAARWQWLDDRTLEIILRPGVKFHDGTVFDAESVKLNYATKGNGTVIPALIPVHGYGYDPTSHPYPFDPNRARQLLQAAGYPDGLSIILIASKDLEVQATVVGKMLEHVGFRVERQMYDTTIYNTKIFLTRLDQPPEQQPWDLALTVFFDHINFPPFHFYHFFALDGPYDWVSEQPALRDLYTQVLGTVDRKQQEALIRQMEGHIRDQAYFLFLYNPFKLYAVNKAVEFVPYLSGLLKLDEVAVSAHHWSVRKQKAAVQE